MLQRLEQNFGMGETEFRWERDTRRRPTLRRTAVGRGLSWAISALTFDRVMRMDRAGLSSPDEES